ncbi:Molybdenum cofactor biosynthesis protein, partial [mine drainage metagenome]
TGASMPEGSDAVVMAEDSIQDSGTISIIEEVSPGTNVSKIGEDISKNYPILQKGDRIKPMHIMAMLSSGTLQVMVKKTIMCGVFSTGNELFDSSSDHLYNSAEPAVKAFFECQYMKIRMLGKCRDSEEDIEQKVSRWINTMDALIVTGGTSLGRYDLVPESLSKISNPVFGG